jgi:hypothetical protein
VGGRAIVMLAMALAVAGCEPSAPPAPPAGAGPWYVFEGSWNAAGSRHILPLGGDRRAAILNVRGTMLLSGPGRPGTGFSSEAIALVDRDIGLVGRSVWTDEHGDKVFSEIAGEGTASSNRITGTFIGGTGRYAGATGAYEFSWQYVIDSDDGTIQGRAIGLKGRVQVANAGERK